MHHRVFPTGASAEVGQDRRHIGPIQQQCEIVHDPRDAGVDTGAGDAAEHVAQKRCCVSENGGLPREWLAVRAMQAARCEQAVGGGLGLKVRELAVRRAGDQNVAIGGQHVAKRSRTALFPENAFDAVPQQSGLGGHSLGEFARIGNLWRIGRKKRFEQRADGPCAVLFGNDSALTVDAPEARRLTQIAVGVPAELQIVGQNKVGQPGPITRQLFVGFHTIQVYANVLALDVSHRHSAADDDEIRRAACNVRRLVDGAHAIAAQFFDQRLQRGPVAVLGRLPRRQRLRESAAIGAERTVCNFAHRVSLAFPHNAAVGFLFISAIA